MASGPAPADMHPPCVLVVSCAGTSTSASLISLTARLVYNDLVLFEKAVGPDGGVVFDKVDFNQRPGTYTLTLQLSPTTESAFAADVSDQATSQGSVV